MAKSKKEPQGPKGAPAYMSTYGDMMTLLLCFFVLLFSMSSVDIRKFQEAMSYFSNRIDVLPGGAALTEGQLLDNGISQLNDIQVIFTGGMPNNETGNDLDYDEDAVEDSEAKKMTPEEYAENLKEKFQEVIKEEGIETEVTVTNQANTVKFTLQGEYLFDSAKADLKKEGLEILDKIATLLTNSEYSDYDIQIEGHTDNLAINNAKFPNNWILSSYRAYAVLDRLIDNYGYDPARISATGYGEYRPIADNSTLEGRARNRRVEIKVILNGEEENVEF